MSSTQPEGESGMPDLLLSFLRISAPLASQCVFLAPLSTMRKIHAERSCGKISVLPFSAMVVSGAVWATYGLLKDDASIWVSNDSRYSEGADRKVIKNHLICGGLIIGLVLLLIFSLSHSDALQCIGLIGTAIVVVMFSGPLATIRTVVRDRSTNSLAPLFTLASLVNCSLWMGLGVAISDTFIWGPNVLGLAAALVQVALFGLFGLPTKVVKSSQDVDMVDKSLSA